MRAMLVLLSLALVLLLGSQVAYQERDRIAALEPRAKPWLDLMCLQLACVVATPRQIEAIHIDGSSFYKVRGDLYKLSLTLRNQSPMTVALPAVELTLTDSQDQPVARRVLPASELGGAVTSIAAGGEFSNVLTLAVAPGGSSIARVAGYRVLAFYP